MLQVRDIDLGSLAEALDSGFDGYDAFYWWNPKINRIDFWTTDLDEERPDVDDLGGITIEAVDSREGYRDMEMFISTVLEPLPKERLTDAIDHKKTFKNFQRVLHQYQYLPREWHAFHDARMRVHAVEWLRDNEVIELAEAESALEKLRAEAAES